MISFTAYPCDSTNLQGTRCLFSVFHKLRSHWHATKLIKIFKLLYEDTILHLLTFESSCPRWTLFTLVAKFREHIVSHKSSSLGLTWTSISVFESSPGKEKWPAITYIIWIINWIICLHSYEKTFTGTSIIFRNHEEMILF